MNIRSKISQDTIDNVKLDRESSLNPPESEPGMSDFEWDDDDFFGGGSSSGFDDDDFFGGGGGVNETSSGGNSGGMSQDLGGFGSTWTPPQGNVGNTGGGNHTGSEDFEDKLFDGMLGVGKKLGVMCKELVLSLQKGNDSDVWLRTTKGSTFAGVGITIIGVILMLFGNAYGLKLLLGGLVTTGISIPIFAAMYEKLGCLPPIEKKEVELDLSKEETEEKKEEDKKEEEKKEEGGFDEGYYEEEEADELGFKEEEGGFDMGYYEEEYEEEEEVIEEDIKGTMEGMIENLNKRNPGNIMTRQYLYDMIYPCLKGINPSYDKVKEIKEGSSDFELWDAVLQNSAEIIKTSKDTDMPYLISAKEKLFYVLLEANRPKWLKNVDTLVKEVVNICSYDEKKMVKNPDIYGTGDMVGQKIYIKIMKGETAMVSLKDTYKSIEKEVLNPKNYMPVVLGVDAEGEVVWKDLKMMDSILVTGMPRSGKSWFVQAMLTQMCMWLKPSELNFYILDPKGMTSDFKSFKLPHVKKFVSDDESILRELRKVVKEEARVRTKLIGDAGCVNIWDYKSKNPDVEIPLIYIMIDEVITLAERMDKETKEEFNSLLLELVSRLPNLGIRVIMIPHLVKDNILKKSITDIIPCRISVRGDALHIEKSTGVSKSVFSNTIKLKHPGDMAVKLNNDDIRFVHSVVLTDSNEGNNELFEFLEKVWKKIEPVEEEVGEEKRGKVKVITKTDMSELLKGVHAEVEKPRQEYEEEQEEEDWDEGGWEEDDDWD